MFLVLKLRSTHYLYLQSRCANDPGKSVRSDIALCHIVFHCGYDRHVRNDGQGKCTFARCAALLISRLLFCQEQEDSRDLQESFSERALALVVPNTEDDYTKLL
jgi:hypothetical protein